MTAIRATAAAAAPGSETDTDTLRFLAGGGEMGALMRAHDWRGSSLGPPAQWPQSLRTVVRLMLNTGHPMYIWWGTDRACLYNDAYRESIGPERHPGSLGRPAREVWAEIWDIINPQIEQVLAGRGATWHVNHLVPITRHGRREDVYWTYSYSPIDDDAAPNGVGGVLVVCSETTQHVQVASQLAAERDHLAQTQARLRVALNAGRMGSWETDHGTLTRHWSNEGMALFGLALPDGRGQVGGPHDEYLAAIHPDDRQVVQRLYALSDEQDSFGAEYRIVRPDGTTLWLSGRGLVLARGPDGKAQRLVSIMADATERKLVEEQLRIERERLSLALSAGQMGAFDMNLQDNVLWWSPHMYALFGVDPERFVPTPVSVIELLRLEDRREFLRLRKQAIALRRPFDFEFRIDRADGTRPWLHYRGQAEYDVEGKPLRSFGVTMDITERKHAEAVLREADREKDDFIAILAHELRNPLAPIRNAIAVLRAASATDATRAWCHDVLDRQVAQMARLLDDLLDVSRLSRGQLRLRREPLSLATAIEHAIETARPLIDAGGHTLSVSLPPQPLHLLGDLTRLAQVFSNVLINAAKYTPRHGTITLSATAQGDHAVVRVTDTGIGIAMEHVSQIFEIFGQVESALDHAQGGQGIGLSLAKGLVEMHGGTIEAHSEGVGKGSEFEIRLPLAPSAPDVQDVPVHAEPGVAAAAALRILIADDLHDAADTLAILLQSMGHAVEVAYDGQQALHLAEQQRPEVVLLDLGMPKIDGYEVARRIRAAPWGTRMMLVAQTGWGQEHDRRRTREAGFDHHVIKPIELQALTALFERRP